MQFVFLDMAGATLFIRDDAERAAWTQEELSLSLEFPYIDDKVISIGQRIFFIDPSTNKHQIYEVKQARTLEPDHYQSVTAEHICISELTDEHIDKKEIEDYHASHALSTVLTNTLWSVGSVGINPVSSVTISRGSVWQAILSIRENWNVYIVPRVELAADGTITRKLDIKSTDGEWNGVRLSIDKNMLDPSVTIDDSEVVTAMYGYGGTIIATKKGEENKEVTFADVVWQNENGHPAKPSGQTYIEYPAATQEYGRNGRPRFGFYQNTDIKDAETLLQKSWESLEAASKPDISIEGTVADLYRMGYADQPIKLYDVALVEVSPAGFKKQIQIIKITTDLLDPSATTLTIGSYIPNIVYINNDTETKTTGSSGGGGNKSKQTERQEFETKIEANNNMIRLRAYQNDLDATDEEVKKQEARITVEHNRITQEVEDRRNADGVLSSKITQTAEEIRAEVQNEVEGLISTITQTASQIRAEVSDSINGVNSSITQTASQIRAEVSDSINGVNSSITQTASQIRSEVSDSINSVNSSITQEASQIRAEVSNSINGVNSSITQTASQIRQEVSDADNGLSSRINVQKDRIDLVVTGEGSSASIAIGNVVDSINGQSGTFVKIQAAKINLSGYVTMTSFNSLSGSVDGILAAGTFGSNKITSTSINATGTLAASSVFNFKGHTVGTYACKTTSDVTFYALGYT